MTRRFKATEDHRLSVRIATIFKTPEGEIARDLGITLTILRKHFAEELQRGAKQLNEAMAGAVFSLGESGNVEAAKYWLANKADWRAPTRRQNINDQNKSGD